LNPPDFQPSQRSGFAFEPKQRAQNGLKVTGQVTASYLAPHFKCEEFSFTMHQPWQNCKSSNATGSVVIHLSYPPFGKPQLASHIRLPPFFGVHMT
jgi:hypothetical protein